MDSAIELTSKLINFPTITPIDAGIIDFLITQLELLGFTCHKLINNKVVNLYARYGLSEPNFCFAGHTDVVEPGVVFGWISPPFEATIIKDTLYGRGVVDMKGAIAAFIEAASFLIKKNLISGSISLMITGDEEADAYDGTIKILEYLTKIKEKITVCLVGEPTSIKEVADAFKVGRRGSANFHLEIIGKQGHVAYPKLADNPITKIAKVIEHLANWQIDEGNEFFGSSNLEFTNLTANNPTCNLIPYSVTADFNIRFNDLHSIDKLILSVNKRIQSVCANYKLTLKNSSEPFRCNNLSLIDLIKNSIYKVTNQHPLLDSAGGTSDARFIKDFCPVIELGLMNQTAHQINESAKLEDIIILKKIYQQILLDYFQ